MLGQGGHGVKHVPRNSSIIDFFGVIMKLNKIAVAGMMLVAGSTFSNFASATVSCTTAPATEADKLEFVNTCAPKIIFSLNGSSALAGTLDSVIQAQFSTAPIKVVDMSSKYGANTATSLTASSPSVTIYYGIRKNTTKPMVIYYQNWNGSAAGVSALIGKKGTVAETLLVDLQKGGDNKCTLGATTNTVNCSNTPAYIVSDLAVSDVAANELLALSEGITVSVKDSKLTEVPLVMQGFGIAVSKALYAKLQAAQSATASCAADTYTPECQPNITTKQFATLISKNGKYTKLGDLLGDNSTDPLTIARRDEASGTQATAQMFFAGSGCSNKETYSMAGSTVVGSNGTNAGADGLITGSNNISVAVKTTSKGVEDLFLSTGYVISILPLSKAAPKNVKGEANFMKTDGTAALNKNWRFVKLDGVSPDLSADSFTGTPALGTRSLADKVRANMITGEWPLQVTSYAYRLTALKGDKKDVADALTSSISNPDTEAPGISYFTGSANQKTQVHKASGNCSPLILSKQ